MEDNQNQELQENSLENTENERFTTKKDPSFKLKQSTDREILVSASQLQTLITQNKELKQDLTALINVFQMFVPMFSGKSSAMILVPTIMKMINNKEVGENIQHIIPIIEKYSNGQK